MAYPAEYTDSDSSEEDSWHFDNLESDGEVIPDEEYYVWRRPNSYTLVPKFQELIRDYPQGIRLRDFPYAYFKKFRERLDWTIFGHNTLKDLIMDYSDVLKCIREGTDPDGWLIIDVNCPPTEEEKTTLSMRLNRELIEEVKARIVKAVKIFFKRKKLDFNIGLPLEYLQTMYQELFGCQVRYEVLGFQSLEKFCLAIDGDGFKVCKIDDKYVIFPPLTQWYMPEPQLQLPFLLEHEPAIDAFPKDTLGPLDTLEELDFKIYLRAGEIIKIVIPSYEDPLNFHFMPYEFYKIYLGFEKGLMKFYCNDINYFMPAHLVRPGQLCVVSYRMRIHNGYVFDRARVIELRDGGAVYVSLIDIGKKVEVPLSVVRFLHKQFASFPVHSLPAELAGINPKSATLDDATKTRIDCYLREPYLEAEIYSPDYYRPLYPLIVYSRCSRKSLNRLLIESGQYRVKPPVPFCILTRKVLPIEPIFTTNSNEQVCRDFVRSGSGWARRSGSLLSEYSDSDEDYNEGEFEELNDPGRKEFYFDPTRLIPTLNRFQPGQSSPHLALRPDPAPLKPTPPLMEHPESWYSFLKHNSDALLWFEQMAAELEQERQEKIQKAERRQDCNREQEPRESPKDDEEGGSQVSVNLMKLRFGEGTSNTANEFETNERALESSEIPISLPAPPRKNEQGSTSAKNLVDDSQSTSFLCSPSTSSVAAHSLGVKKAHLNLNRQSNKRKNRKMARDDDSNKICFDPPDRSTFLEIEGVDFESSDSSESLSDIDDSCSASIQNSSHINEIYWKLSEEMEINMLVMKFLSSNPIIREVGLQEPGMAFKVARKWAEYAIRKNNGSPPDATLFNPFFMYPDARSKQSPSELRSLTEMLPRNIYKKFLNLARTSGSKRSDESCSTENSGNDSYQPPESRNKVPIHIRQDNGDEEFSEPYVLYTSLKRMKKNKPNPYQMKLGNHGFECSKHTTRVFCKLSRKIHEQLKDCGWTSVKWFVNNKNEQDAFNEFTWFLQMFEEVVQIVLDKEKNIKREILDAKKR